MVCLWLHPFWHPQVRNKNDIGGHKNHLNRSFACCFFQLHVRQRTKIGHQVDIKTTIGSATNYLMHKPETTHSKFSSLFQNKIFKCIEFFKTKNLFALQLQCYQSNYLPFAMQFLVHRSHTGRVVGKVCVRWKTTCFWNLGGLCVLFFFLSDTRGFLSCVDQIARSSSMPDILPIPPRHYMRPMSDRQSGKCGFEQHWSNFHHHTRLTFKGCLNVMNESNNCVRVKLCTEMMPFIGTRKITQHPWNKKQSVSSPWQEYWYFWSNKLILQADITIEKRTTETSNWFQCSSWWRYAVFPSDLKLSHGDNNIKPYAMSPVSRGNISSSWCWLHALLQIHCILVGDNAVYSTKGETPNSYKLGSSSSTRVR